VYGMRPLTFVTWILALASLLVTPGATYACTGPEFRKYPTESADAAKSKPPPLDRISVRVLRADSRPWVLCPEIPTVVLVLESDTRANLDGFGVRLRLLRGKVPFDVPPDPITVWGGGKVASHWYENPSRARKGFQARLAASLVSASGDEGPAVEFEIDEPPRPPVLPWPDWLRDTLFHMVMAGHKP